MDIEDEKNPEIQDDMNIEDEKISETQTTFFTHKNVVYVKNTEILKWPDIVSKLGALGQDCGGHGAVQPCQHYGNCNGYVVMYVEGIEDRFPSSLFDISPASIKAYAIAIIFDSPDVTELWDVCTGKESRGKGYASQILSSILMFNTKSQIWLGVLFWNPTFEAVVRLYVKNGFQHPDFSNRSISGSSFPFSFLSLYWERGLPVPEQKETIEAALRFKEEYMGTRGKCSIRLRFENSLLKAMFDMYSTKEVEYGGKMRIFEYVDTGASYRAARVGFSPQLEVEGSKTGLTVVVPPAPINFHTHPNICYATYGCYLGWPSSDDMAYVISNYERGVRLHMLISQEGVYFVSLSSNFSRAWNSAPQNFKNGMIRAVKTFFGTIEGHRAGSNIPLSFADATLSAFLTGVNKFSTDNALDWLHSQGYDVSDVVRDSVTSFPIFQVLYLNWIDVENTPIIEFDFHYIPSNNSKVWPNKCDIFEKSSSDQNLAYSGSQLLELRKKI